MLHAIIMAGGSGTRFWPKSRRDRPKQLLRLTGEETMLQQTVMRIEPLVPRDRILIVTGADQAEATRAQLPDLPPRNVIAEPCPRDTAPCVGLAAGVVSEKDPVGTMIVMPADHVIEPAEAFLATVRAAVSVIDDDPSTLITFGIKPTHPETGYGYIERGPLLEKRDGIPVHRVVQFREKPDRETAERFVAAGNFAWNSGIFVWRAQTILNELHAHRPMLAAGLEPILRAIGTPGEAETLGAAIPRARAACRSIRPSWKRHRTCGCSKFLTGGTTSATGALWPAYCNVMPPATRSRGNVVARDSTGSILISDDGGLVAVLGVEDLVVVHSGNATLVARKDQLDKLKGLVEGLAGAVRAISSDLGGDRTKACCGRLQEEGY